MTESIVDPAGPPALPCGSWPSPLAAATLASAALRLATPAFARDGSVLWLEGRPSEGGRTVLVQQPPEGTPRDLSPAPLDLRSRVHEYGGGAYTVIGGAVIYADGKTGAIYTQRPGEAPTQLAAPGAHWRFGDLTADPAHGRVLAVAEIHPTPDKTPSGEHVSPENVLVAIDAGTGSVEVLVSGADFYASPAPSPDGRHLAWLSWSHPHMPWDAAALHVAELDEAGRPRSALHVAGDATASAQQPAYAVDGTLYFLFEGGTGAWNLYRLTPDGPSAVSAQPGAELGLPPWQLGVRTWDFLDETAVIAAAISNGETHLSHIDLTSGTSRRLAVPVAQVNHLAARAGRVVLLAGLADRPGGVYLLEIASGALTPLRTALPFSLEPAYVAKAQSLSFTTTDDDVAHGFFYAPRNPQAQPRPGERPPLVVIAHGGPTAAATPAFNALIQFWTTRGLAVLDVNYRGSTGYGRAFRDRLRGQWGVYDVADCIAGARALAAQGLVDPARVAIRGSSAGGFTALAALAASDDGGQRVFAAGASLYGVSDLAALARDTHKFEAHYLDALIGPWPARADLYAARSPINHAAQLTCPIVFFQGRDDRVVPLDQAERLVAALAEKHLPAELYVFDDEQHGFRKAATIETVYRTELAFYGRVFGFSPS
jgi:dipeptidyl aminopeptidase/acylaminoacyl peptidase